ncbi:MAG: type I pullulanase [Candidatus Enteromonas sp.]|nr:type I pullulanase [Candidatus Enteromonas sp.]
MKNSFLGAKLVAPNKIRIAAFTSLPLSSAKPCLIIDSQEPIALTPSKSTSLGLLYVRDYDLAKPLELGHHYFVGLEPFGLVNLDVNEFPSFEGFDERYHYEGDDLGANYSKEKTVFKIFAPVASFVEVRFRKAGSKETYLAKEATRLDCGVFVAEIEGDLDGYEYLYAVLNSETMHLIPDPYAKASVENGRASAVVDFSRFDHIQNNEDALPVIPSPTDAVIYETHVRDFTISLKTDIEHKGKFLGFVEKGRKTIGGHPAALDYLKTLGPSHVQLLPIYDYQTVDELHPSSRYNWGYDPMQYFVPEGSYATDPRDPYSRIEECKRMISVLHDTRIGVVMDVVYNHVYESTRSIFEKAVPNYYFRRNSDGRRANTSGCGNDLDTERPMVRKLIVDSALWWVKFYRVDGFRFDLMGIIDVKTLQEIETKAKAIKPNFLLYGEGWNMGGETKIPLGRMQNYKLLPGYGFFNDTYREATKRFFSGDFYSIPEFKFSLVSSSLPFFQNPMFLDARQSINYIECHDNGTYFDILSSRRKDLGEQEKKELVLAASAAVLLSFGVPFLHMGQEIAASKWGEENTYNKGDDYNKLSGLLVDERYDMVETLSKFILFRKRTRFLHVYDPKVIDGGIIVTDFDGCVRLIATHKCLIEPFTHLEFFFNPTDHDIPFTLEGNQTVLLSTKEAHSEGGKIIVPARSTLVSAAKEAI